MTDGSLFLRRGDDLVELAVSAFASEDLLQRLLAENPSLLASPTRSQRLVLIDREMGVPDAAGASDRWSIDHVFVDADAVPVIVEVKRATDTRLRREVVAQMLDYAANIGRYWPAERLRTSFAERAETLGEDAEAFLVSALGREDVDAFWAQVAANLEAGRMRLVFVADEIPRELLRIVEFLNARMSPTEVVAIELRQFVAGDEQVVAPRVLGESVTATDRKQSQGGGAARPAWSASDVRTAFGRLPPEAARASLEIFDWLEANSRPFGGSGNNPSITFWTGTKAKPRLCVTVYTEGEQLGDNFTVNWQWIARYVPREPMTELAADLRAIAGIPGRLEGLEAAEFLKRPGIRIVGILDAPGASAKFLAALKRFDERASALSAAASAL
ncbi:MAG TPA: hypothetical protein VGO31_15520 [Microbacteriaceae bacterium]|jgi:hypothetical protein|nr:hypothetical protein [Microbacteriaceae bacterium]